MKVELPALLEALLPLVAEAGEAILQVYEQGGTAVTRKADDSPLTEADLASQRVLARGLAALTPAIPVLSEEAADVPYEERRRWRRLWVVDPLDGTKEFVKRNDEFTVNVALVEDGEPLLGVVLAPALGRTYAAARGVGAFSLEAGGERQRIGAACQGPELVVVASRSHPSLQLAAFLRALPPHRLTEVGSALKLCLVAAGEADLYPRLGPTMEWDTAAADAVVREAGGRVIDLGERPLRYNKSDLLNPHFLVVGRRRVPWQPALAAHLGG